MVHFGDIGLLNYVLLERCGFVVVANEGCFEVLKSDNFWEFTIFVDIFCTIGLNFLHAWPKGVIFE